MPPPKTVFALFHTDEIRHPYETAVAALGARVRWFDNLEALTAAGAGEAPLAVFVDLDHLPTPWETSVQALRAAFPKSDLVGLSATDSASTALKAIRSGFSDYLLKPVSPEELAWCLRRSQQRQDLLQRFADPRARLIRALTQVSSATSPWLLRLGTLEFLQQMLESQGAAWLGEERELLCGIPRKVQSATLERLLPKGEMTRTRIFRNNSTKERKVYLPLQDPKAGGVLLWGIPGPIPGRSLHEAKVLLEHAQVCLLNLEKYEEVKQRTFVDDLTGLYNSRYLRHAITNAIVRSSQNARHFAVLFIDVDKFKGINDRYGHLVGSQLLVAIARAIRNTVRVNDPVFRYGGDEFVVILHDTNQEGAKEIGERLRRGIERRVFVIGENRIQTTISVGIAIYPDHTMEKDTLLRLADQAMYSVKRDSRNAVHLAYPAEADLPQEGKRP